MKGLLSNISTTANDGGSTSNPFKTPGAGLFGVMKSK